MEIPKLSKITKGNKQSFYTRVALIIKFNMTRQVPEHYAYNILRIEKPISLLPLINYIHILYMKNEHV